VTPNPKLIVESSALNAIMEFAAAAELATFWIPLASHATGLPITLVLMAGLSTWTCKCAFLPVTIKLVLVQATVDRVEAQEE
jgi:hypothetical protein